MKNDYTILKYDFNFFENENKPLIVIGLSGSGKTTLCNKLSKKYNCKHIKEDKIIFKKFGREKIKLGPFLKEKDLNDISNFIEIFFKKKKKFIYEGNKILNFFNYDIEKSKILFKDCSFIIMNTCMETSCINGAKRGLPGNMTYDEKLERKRKQNKEWEKHLLIIKNWLDERKFSGED